MSLRPAVQLQEIWRWAARTRVPPASHAHAMSTVDVGARGSGASACLRVKKRRRRRIFWAMGRPPQLLVMVEIDMRLRREFGRRDIDVQLQRGRHAKYDPQGKPACACSSACQPLRALGLRARGARGRVVLFLNESS